MSDKQEADLLARMWKEGLVAPEDFHPEITEWRTQKAIEQAVKQGDIHRLQVVDELERRKDAGQFKKETPAFVDKFPRKYGKG